MRIASLLDPIDPVFMTDATTEAGGIRISNSAIAILLFLVAQTLAGVWWAATMNEQMRNVNLNMSAQSAVEKQRSEMTDGQLKDLQGQIKLQEMRVTDLRERLAAKGWKFDADPTHK